MVRRRSALSAAQRTIGRCRVSRGTGARHFATDFGAFAAGFGAFLAMIHFVLRAFFAAGVADFGAKLAGAFDEVGTARHLPHAVPAHICATAIQFDAARHHFDVILVQAGRRAMFASDEAFVAGFNTVIIFFV